ncbi:MAG: hypothetical protein DSY83_03450 [Flavobacteriia bacterium]|nr:MAG: hypothetical protein DSY83_03450 [Flavobacteriia bacterium]
MTNNQQKTVTTKQQKQNACGAELTQKQVVKTKKPMTEAMKKIDQFRDNREGDYQQKIMAEDNSCVVYLYESNGKPCATGYRGRARKAAFRYYYQSEESRLERITEWMESQIKSIERRKPEARALNVGDVLYASWGYEQTNIDYYMVTKLVGKASVELVEIGRESEATGDMQGACVPDKTKILSDPFVRRADGSRVKINGHISAGKKESRIIAGCEVFSVDRYTSYH